VTQRETIEAFVDACRAGDETRASSLFAPDGAFLEPDRAPVVGRAAICEHFGGFFHSGLQWRWTVNALLEAGDRSVLVYRFAIRGPNGDWREHDGCAIVSFEGDAIREWREFRG
jgi:ketosteroid isomerase-like protein